MTTELRGRDLILHTRVGDDLARAQFGERYGVSNAKDGPILLRLDKNLSDRLNAAVFSFYSRLRVDSHPRPKFYKKDDKKYNPGIAVYQIDYGASYMVDVVAFDESKNLVSAYKIGCVVDEIQNEMIAMITDQMSLSQNRYQISELDLDDVIAILNSTDIVSN